MNERKLRIFQEVAIKLNMTEVAEKLYISQPAVSQAIQEMEQHLNVKLFDRIGKRIYLTSEGNIFLSYVRRILNLYDEAVETISDSNNLKSGKLKIGASTTIGIYVLPDIIGEFIKKYKDIDVSICIENTKIISDMILQNKLDFAFVEGPVYDNEISVKKFCEDELIFITSSGHNWSNKINIQPNDILSEKVIMREKGSGTREVFENLMSSLDENYNIAFELGNTEAIKKAVEAGLGISCISKRCIKNELIKGTLSQVRLKSRIINRQFSLIYHRDKFLSKLFLEFINFATLKINNI